MIPAGNKARCLSSVNQTAKSIHHHHLYFYDNFKKKYFKLCCGENYKSKSENPNYRLTICKANQWYLYDRDFRHELNMQINCKMTYFYIKVDRVFNTFVTFWN